MYQPKNGDRVRLTRVHAADGHTVRIVGVVSEVFTGGFRLTGHLEGGGPVDSYYAADMSHPRSGCISQTIEPAPEATP